MIYWINNKTMLLLQIPTIRIIHSHHLKNFRISRITTSQIFGPTKQKSLNINNINRIEQQCQTWLETISIKTLIPLRYKNSTLANLHKASFRSNKVKTNISYRINIIKSSGLKLNKSTMDLKLNLKIILEIQEEGAIMILIFISRLKDCKSNNLSSSRNNRIINT